MSHRPTLLTPDDYELLQQLMSTLIGSRSAVAAILREKLSVASVMSPGDVHTDVATVGSTVHYRVGEAAGPAAKLVRGPTRPASGTLSVLDPHGLALLGLRTGQSITIPGGNGYSETLVIEAVDRTSSGNRGERAGTVVAFPPTRRHAAKRSLVDDDPPGPSAA